MREALASGGLDRYRTVVKALAEEFEILDVAAAAVKLAHEPADSAAARRPSGHGFGLGARGDHRDRDGPRLRRAGRTAGVRPKDLVGAITKGAGVAAAALGAIQIGDRSSVVEVRASEVKAFIDGLRKTPLRGKKVPVRLYEER